MADRVESGLGGEASWNGWLRILVSSPGSGLVGRFGDTVVLISRGASAPGREDRAASELLELAAAVAADRQLPATVIAARLAGGVIGHMADDATAFGIVVPVEDGVALFLRGAVSGTVTERGFTHQLSGEQALTWVDQLIPGTFERLCDRHRGRSACAAGSALGPSRRGGTRAGLRADPGRKRARARSSRGCGRLGLGRNRQRPPRSRTRPR